MPLRRIWVVLDPTLRTLKVTPFRPDGSEALELMQYLKSLPPPERFAGFEVQAPILVLPNVFEPEFCAKLIAQYEASGGQETGFMRDIGGIEVPEYLAKLTPENGEPKHASVPTKSNPDIVANRMPNSEEKKDAKKG